MMRRVSLGLGIVRLTGYGGIECNDSLSSIMRTNVFAHDDLNHHDGDVPACSYEGKLS